MNFIATVIIYGKYNNECRVTMTSIENGIVYAKLKKTYIQTVTCIANYCIC